MNFRDYVRAVACGARGRGLGVVPASAEVIEARLRCGLGPRLYSMFSLWRHPRSEWSGYIDDHRNKPRMQAVNTDGNRRVVDDKVRFFLHCRANSLPTVAILGLIGGGNPAASQDLPSTDSLAELDELLAGHPDGLFLKPTGGSHGEGAFGVLPVEKGVRWRGAVTTLDALYSHCQEVAAATGPLIVQPRVRPARRMLEITSAYGLATVRAVTWMDGSRPRLLAACLRIPVGDSDADNFLGGASGNLVAAIDPASGCLYRVLGSRRRDWPDIVEVDVHPDTGRRIPGFVLPGWDALLELVLRAQQQFPGLRTIGWDVAITDSGPLLIEGNGSYDVDILQMAHDRGLRAGIERALEGGGTVASDGLLPGVGEAGRLPGRDPRPADGS